MFLTKEFCEFALYPVFDVTYGIMLDTNKHFKGAAMVNVQHG
jgi:hypothetical protein